MSEVAVGDLNSDARGSGARKNAGKPQLDLVPVATWRVLWRRDLAEKNLLNRLMVALDEFQKGHDGAIDQMLAELPARDRDLIMGWTVEVLEFGAEKYKAWNWAKGMPWSVVTGCILRHTQAIIDGEDIDPESGEPHLGHIFCNLVFLSYYVEHYREGDDRPPRYEEDEG